MTFLFCHGIAEQTISRVMSLSDHLSRPCRCQHGSSDLPESTTGRRIAFYSVLLRMGFTCARSVTSNGGSLLHCLSTLTCIKKAVYFCCTGLGVASTGRYPASCPVKPGLSSSAPFRPAQPRSPGLLAQMLF